MTNTQILIGKSLEEARALVTVPVREVIKDGESLFRTMNLIPGRINVETKAGKIVRINFIEQDMEE